MANTQWLDGSFVLGETIPQVGQQVLFFAKGVEGSKTGTIKGFQSTNLVVADIELADGSLETGVNFGIDGKTETTRWWKEDPAWNGVLKEDKKKSKTADL